MKLKNRGTYMELNVRDRRIDILRGFAVIFVVLTHCGFPLSGFLYQFHTALFFMVSGYFWKQQYSENSGGGLKS